MRTTGRREEVRNQLSLHDILLIFHHVEVQQKWSSTMSLKLPLNLRWIIRQSDGPFQTWTATSFEGGLVGLKYICT